MRPLALAVAMTAFVVSCKGGDHLSANWDEIAPACGSLPGVSEHTSDSDSKRVCADGQWATNGNHYGIFQISYVHAPNFPGFYENWMDPVFNIEVAFAIWSEQGWYPWSCRPY
jgi:hypothetical protein